MHRSTPCFRLGALFSLAVTLAPLAVAQERPNTEALIAGQRDAMKALASMHGVWRGPAWVAQPGGERKQLTQTERIGPFLDGSLQLIEGRGYMADGSIGFRAFGVVSFDPQSRSYRLVSHAQGQTGSFDFAPTADGYRWSIPIGSGASIRYTAVIAGGVLHEVGDRVAPGQEPQRIFEMTLHRVGDTDWPEAGAVPAR